MYMTNYMGCVNNQPSHHFYTIPLKNKLKIDNSETNDLFFNIIDYFIL